MPENKKISRVPLAVLAAYTLLLYAAWTAYHVLLQPRIDAIPNELLSSLLGDGLVKNLLWTLPAAVLIKKYAGALAVSPREFLTWKKGYAVYLLIFPAFAAYIALGLFSHKQPPAFTITVSEAVTVIFVGVTEELVFRGWLLNASAKYIPEKARTESGEETIPWGEYAVIAVNAVLFLLVHFPRWIMTGQFAANFASLGFLSIIMLSVVFSLVFLRTKNLLLPIILHMFWDFLVFFLY